MRWGHYVHQHSYSLMAAFGILAVIVLFLTKLLFPVVNRIVGGGRAIKGIADPAGFPVLNITIGLVMLLATPAISTITRVTRSVTPTASRWSTPTIPTAWPRGW